MMGPMTPGSGELRSASLLDGAPRFGPRWRCVLVGGETLLIQCATMLEERGHEIAAIVSRNPDIHDWAAGRGIPMLEAARVLIQAELPPFDYLFSVANLTILPPDVLALPRQAAINFHDGPLPARAGVNAPVWALLEGERQHGVTWHLMRSEVDEGDILATRTVELDEADTAFSANTKCFAAAVESFAAMVDGLAEGTLLPCPQGERKGRYHGLADRPARAATIDWSAPAEKIVRLVRALDHGGHANPLGLPKFAIDGALYLARGAGFDHGVSGFEPGMIVGVEGDRLTVASGTAGVVIERITTLDGQAADLPAMVGRRMDAITDEQAHLVGELDAAVGRHERWWRRRLAMRAPYLLPQIDRAARSAADGFRSIDLALPTADGPEPVVAALAAYLGRLADKASFDLGFIDPVFAARFEGVEGWFARQVPLPVRLDFAGGFDALREALADEVCQLHRHIGHAADLTARCPELMGQGSALPVAIMVVDRLDVVEALSGSELTIAVRSDGGETRWIHDESLLDRASVRAMQQGFEALFVAALATPDLPLGQLPMMNDGALEALIETGNDTAAAWREDACIHQLFADQAARTPDRPAVTCRGTTLPYSELDARSNRLARHLVTLGVGPDVLVGLHVERSVEMLIALIAIHKAGGAYVPLDPDYPADRIAYMIEDAGAPVIVSQCGLATRLPATAARIVCIDRDWPTIAQHSAEPVEGGAQPHNLAYVIYTSGSTGRPKGVMVEHRNVANFFAGMDAKLEPDGTWLAVTSLSFDISVLELCWTLARGFHVVVATGDEMKGGSAAAAPAKSMDFSLFYFASADGGASGPENYRLLLEGAKFADEHDFTAVWTPERHFHAFGGLYPNPAVTGAAVAAITKRVQIRGGSVVLPLHHPIRVAEEWSLVDNLSNGRVGIAFASGWQPNDFVLRPEAFAERSSGLVRDIEVVRSLWRGEARAFPGPLGRDVDVSIYPRPVQAELPFWITSAGNPETFAAAGRAGAFVLTHLLGQTTEELAEKLALYRRAWGEAGHPGEGHVTLMLHSFVGEDGAAVRDAVRQPLIEYLRTSTGLVKQYAWSFPAFKRPAGTSETSNEIDLDSMTPEEMDALLEHAFERYYETSGLFGTPEQCLSVIDKVRAVGVDEIACLIDFGVPAQQVLHHLPALDRLRQLANGRGMETAPAEETLTGLMTRHRVTHLQCTPSMAQMLVADPAARPGLGGLKRMMIGGEAFPPALARELRGLVGGAVMNMYGPTETTIWSSVHELDGAHASVPLGQPLANQQVYILDSRRQPLPAGIPGELVIGGRGVVRGYLHRPELTAERFVAHPFRVGERAYRTGDLARRNNDGTLEFLGRLDHQVKIRGYRIELGEIEAVLASFPGVGQVVVVAREDVPGDVRLVGYYTGAVASAAELKAHLQTRLPDFMVPAHLVPLPALPKTPNGKIARDALPQPATEIVAAPGEAFVEPADGVEGQIAAIWREVLKLPRVGKRDNFFDLGGHSLLAVQVHRRLRASFAQPVSITDIFRFPTIEALSAHLGGAGDDDAAVRQGEARAQNRRAALQRRRGISLQAGVGEGS
jgi:natural product biosynthesis luciferase-like monooxygenase protein